MTGSKSPNNFAVAAGDRHTAEAGREILEKGGNAYDAIVAMLWTATVTEPCLTSLGGGGFCLAKPADQEAKLFDFFVQTPRRKNLDQEIDFYPVEVDFGGAVQEFQVGRATVATPGVVAGLFAIHQHYGRLPMKEVAQPAIRWAREGFKITGFQTIAFQLLDPIFKATPESLRVFGKDDGNLVGEGDILKNPDLAQTIELLVEKGPEVFYRGELAEKIAAAAQTGGFLTKEDLENYQVKEKQPLSIDYRGARFLTNSPPSAGGILIAFALKLLERVDWSKIKYLSAAYVELLTEAMRQTQLARRQKLDKNIYRPEIAAEFLDNEFQKSYAEKIEELLKINRWGSTTHLSVIDAEGNMASLTATNGEGSGVVVPGTGIMLNNMLGEEDLNPHGFHQWPENKRLSSMMAPSLLLSPEIDLVVGSAGSNRIRSAILQTIIRAFDYRLPLEEAVNGPRLHFENERLDLEPGFPEETIVEIKEKKLTPEIQVWEDTSVFFGGANCVAHDKVANQYLAASDHRRSGVGLVNN